MASAENALLQYEAGQVSYAMGVMTNSGDNKTFTSSADQWSSRSGFAAVVRPNGIRTGGVVVPAAAGGNNNVDVSAISLYLNGADSTVAAGTNVAITRPATAVAKVNSITINSSGTIAVVAGTDGGSTTFSETRGAAGGPPFIPVDSVELAQVRVTSNTAAPITTAQIFSVPGTHTELATYPVYEIDRSAGSVTFATTLPASHTGSLPKRVYASYAEPSFADVQNATDFVPPENSHSVTSTQVYGGTIGATSSSLGQGTFTAYLSDGVSDPLVQLKDEVLWFRFYPDRNQNQHLLVQGKLGISRSFPSGDNIQAACTISSDTESIEVI